MTRVERADIVVIGAGPAGIAAAVSASELGASVLLFDHGLEPGGQIWRHRAGARVPRTASRWLARLRRSGARVLRGVSVLDVRRADDGSPFEIVAEHDGSSAVVHARRIVLATGARELFIPFPGWTLPGVVGVGGAQALLKAGTSFRGKRVVIAGSGPLLLPVAASLATRGARLAIVAEQTPREAVVSFVSGLWRSPSLLAQAAQYRARFASTRYATGTWVTEAHGREHVTAVTLTDGRRTWREDADVLCTGYGLVPSVELARVLGCDVRDDAVVVDDIQQTSVAGVYAAGEVTGVGGAPLALIEGEIAGTAATARHVAVGSLMHRRDALRASARRMRATFAPRAELRACVTPDTIVCRCEDVTLAAVSHAPNARAAKLYTRAGMGPCQGRTCAPALSFLCGWAPDTVRSPVEPALISVLATDSTSSDSGATS